MIPSIEGLIVAAVLLLLGYSLGAPLIIGLFASLPFGSTAFATLTAVGGSSPLIYTLFAVGFIIAMAVRRSLLRDLGTIFTTHISAWIVLLLSGYVIASAILFPRLFAGQTTAFVPVEGLITEMPLTPVSGNITQTAYFLLGALVFYAMNILLLRRENLQIIERGFLTLIIMNISLGVLDLAGKIVGLSDILLPIRTVSYALHTETQIAGFWRIAGGYSEASAFGGMMLICLSFSYAYWRATKKHFAFVLTLASLALLVLSTSTTAYAGLIVLSLFPAASLVVSAYRNRLTTEDFTVMAGGLSTLFLLFALFLYDRGLFQPLTDLIETTILDKPLSQSAEERSYWNYKSLQNFLDTSGVGVGMGSSRSSSWLISVLSQLGLIGALAMSCLSVLIMRGLSGLRPTGETAEVFALVSGVRAAVIAMLVAGSLAGSGADPGILFFIALAVVVACRRGVESRLDVISMPARLSSRKRVP